MGSSSLGTSGTWIPPVLVAVGRTWRENKVVIHDSRTNGVGRLVVLSSLTFPHQQLAADSS